MGTYSTGPETTAKTDVAPEKELGVPVVPVVVVDNPGDRRLLMAHIVEQTHEFGVAGYADGPVNALEAVERLGADAVVVEIQLPVSQGLDTVSALRDAFPSLAIIVCSFHDHSATKEEALGRGADGYLSKPVSPRDLHGLLRLALQNRSIKDVSIGAGSSSRGSGAGC